MVFSLRAVIVNNTRPGRERFQKEKKKAAGPEIRPGGV